MLSKAGLGSRTQARSWIHAGRVTVNGRVVQNPDHWIDFRRDKIAFDGKPLRSQERVYVQLYKPTGYITTFRDPEGRPTVYDLIGDVETFVSPVGRLDQDTSGLLIPRRTILSLRSGSRIRNPQGTEDVSGQMRGRLSDETARAVTEEKGVELAKGRAYASGAGAAGARFREEHAH